MKTYTIYSADINFFFFFIIQNQQKNDKSLVIFLSCAIFNVKDIYIGKAFYKKRKKSHDLFSFTFSSVVWLISYFFELVE